MAQRFGWDSLGLRFLLAFAVVLATFNPSGYSFWHWAAAEPLALTPGKGIAGVVLLIGWVVFIRATMNSLGGLGVVLAAALLGFLLWGLIQWGVVPRDNVTLLTWIGLLIVTTILAIGMSWSHIRRRLSGQLDVDDVETG